MNPVVETLLRDNEEALAQACQRFGVERLELFGSGLTNAFDSETSDLDFVVEFLPEARRHAFDNFFGLRERLQEVLGRPVELVTRRSLRNPYLIRAIEQSRRVLYGSQP